MWLLLQGADLDKNFHIVFPEKKGVKIEENSNKEEQVRLIDVG